jgi:hypothetical protein
MSTNLIIGSLSQISNSCLANIARLHYKYNIYRTTNLSEAQKYEPLHLTWIDPQTLTQELPGPNFRNKHTPGVVVGGNWDLNTVEFADTYLSGFKQRFIEGLAWENTALYRDAINRTPGKYWHGCKTKKEILSRLHQYDLIFESIVKNGYQTQRELAKKTKKSIRQRFWLSPPELRQIIVHI